MVPKKHKSKRTSLRQKYKVIRKVNEHRRKVNKIKKKNPHLANRKTKDPGIPNTWPHKEELLQEIDNTRQAMLAAKAAQKEARLAAIEKKRRSNMAQQNKGKSMAQFAQEAAAREEKFAMDQDNEGDEDMRERVIMGQGISESRTYYKEFRKVVELSDVILEVLDARDPLGCRCREIEQRITRLDPSKRVILILNKIDLVPQDVAVKWLKYLRNELPTVAFKASTQTQRRNIGSRAGGATKQNANLKTSEALGADTLVQLLKNYSRNQKLKTSICVGIIGYPNVGKSSIINSLKRSKAANVGSTPGLTKSVQEVHLDKKVRLLDSPGIVFTNGNDISDADAILRNSIKVDKIADPVLPVGSILKRCSPEYLQELYSIPAFPKGTDEFLQHIARRSGRLKKGGTPDIESSARKVLQDWNGGVIRYFTEPPEERPDTHLGASVVSAWGKEFNIEDIVGDEASLVTKMMDTEDNEGAADFVQVAPGPAPSAAEGFLMNGNSGDGASGSKGDHRAKSAAGRARKAAMQQDDDDDDEMDASSDDGLRNDIDADGAHNSRVGKAKKAAMKKAKRDARRGRGDGAAMDTYDFTEGWESDGGSDDDA